MLLPVCWLFVGDCPDLQLECTYRRSLYDISSLTILANYDPPVNSVHCSYFLFAQCIREDLSIPNYTFCKVAQPQVVWSQGRKAIQDSEALAI